MSNKKIPPENQLITHVPFISPEKALLDNGFPVYYLPGGTEEVIRIELIFFAGSYNQPKPLIAYSSLNLMKSGTPYHSAEEINEVLDFYGVHLVSGAQKDISSVVVYTLNKNLGPVLELLREVIRNPVFPHQELNIFLKNQRQSFIINKAKVDYLSRSSFNEALFGADHPYGYRLKEEDFNGVQPDDLAGFHKQHIHGGNGVCIASGKIPGDFFQKLNRYFGDDNWIKPKTERFLKTVEVIPAAEGKISVDKPDAVQSSIRIGKRMIKMNHADYHKLVITNALLGGFFGSRLMRNIRQEKGYTYGIHSSLISLIRHGYFFIGTQVGKDVCQKAIDEIYLELKKLRSVPAGDQELEILKNYLSGNYLRLFDGPFAQAEKFKEILLFGLDTDYFDKFLIELKNIPAEKIMEIAGKYLHEDSMIQVVAGNKY